MSTQTHSSRRTDALKASPRMFESRLLDRLSRVHPAIVPLIFVPAIVVLLRARRLRGLERARVVGWSRAARCSGRSASTGIHRLVFHFEPRDGIGARLHWIIHGVHHDHPNDPLRLVMPPSVSVPLGALFFGLFCARPAARRSASASRAGFFVGYLVYDMTHYYVHHLMPEGRLGRVMRELHMRHHFQDDTKRLRDQRAFWDYVFRTPLRRGRCRHAARVRLRGFEASTPRRSTGT